MMTKIARGRNQEAWLSILLAGKTLENPVASLSGNARKYSSNYERSFNAFLARLTMAGYIWERTPGPRGGQYHATYRIVVNEYRGGIA